MQPETPEAHELIAADDVPVGKPVPKPPEPPTPPPTLEELIPMQAYAVNSGAVADLYDRASRPAPVGEINRKNLTFTITPQTDDEWRDFLQTHTGTLPQRGKGISSAMVELSMQVLMAIVADFKLSELAISLTEISASDKSRQQLKANLVRLAEQL